MSNTMGGDAVGAAIAPTPWRRSKVEGVPRPLPSDEPFELPPAPSADADCAEFEMLVRRQLELLGEDPDRDGLQKTPERVVKALAWLTRGHSLDARAVIGDALFEETHESMVMVRDIELYSMCEHHMLPFFGKAHIAYIPDGRIVGLSKLPRIVEAFARRLQVQERLTEQVADAIEEVLRPLGVGVVIEAVHLCMMMRGVEKQNSKTITSALRGQFRDCPMTREEFSGSRTGPESTAGASAATSAPSRWGGGRMYTVRNRMMPPGTSDDEALNAVQPGNAFAVRRPLPPMSGEAL
jgi:GTP cyclohydrolase IA